MRLAKRINADDGGLIGLGIVVVFVFFALLQPLERQTQRCQKGIRPCTLFSVAKALPGLARMVNKQAGPKGSLARHDQDKKACHEASPILKRGQSEIHSLTVCRLSIGIRGMVKACS
jgi:hypothetical protein